MMSKSLTSNKELGQNEVFHHALNLHSYPTCSSAERYSVFWTSYASKHTTNGVMTFPKAHPDIGRDFKHSLRDLRMLCNRALG